jgi:hypothetical protein
MMRRIAPVLVGLLAIGTPSVNAADIVDSLKVLLAVGPRGQGHAAASKAWQNVVAADASSLPTVLASLDSAGPLAANWIHAAVDSIAERQLQSGGPSSAPALEKFLLDTKHSPRARRLAFDWLTRFDPSAPDRLIPGFLHDPSVELRRDAVSRLVKEADGLLKNADQDDPKKQQAATVLQTAFSGARDLDQIQDLTKSLKELGIEVDLPRHFGFLMKWKLIGPFDNTNESAFDIAFPPETEIDFKAKYPGKGREVAWIDHETEDAYGKVNLNEALGKANGVVGYAVTDFTSPREQEVEFRLGCICACKVWLNGRLVDGHKVYHSGSQVDQYISRATLQAGENRILVKVLQNEQTEKWAQDWEFQLRICDSAGTAILSQDRLAKRTP